MDRDYGPETLKRCYLCRRRKARRLFPLWPIAYARRNKLRDPYRQGCKRCMNRLSTDRLREKATGVTREQYDAMLRRQRGVCAICGCKESRRKELAVDHDHTTGRVRGLLCSRCNGALGLLYDSIALLRTAIRYLGA